jgi:hypothetical protein
MDLRVYEYPGLEILGVTNTNALRHGSLQAIDEKSQGAGIASAGK